MAIAATITLVLVNKNHNTKTQSNKDKSAMQTDVNPETKKKKLTRLIATGDFIAHDAINLDAKTTDGYSYDQFISDMKPVLQTADIRFCNQATLVGGEQYGVTGYPAFNAPAAFIDAIAGVGCNVINTASNHSSDKNQSVIDANNALWKNKPNMLAVAGQNSTENEKNMVQVFEVDGIKYAFLAYTTYTNNSPPTTYGVNIYNRTFAASQIASAKKLGAQFLIVSMRWGTEYSEAVNAYQRAEAQYLSDLGVSLILGHGPHVLEPVEYVKGSSGNNTLVWYSLGNFFHAQLEAETLFNGIAVITIDPSNATIMDVGFLPTYMHYDWTVDQAAKQDLLARKNFQLVPLEKAQELFTRSHLQTTIEAQKERLKKTLNTYTSVPFVSLSQLGL